MKVKDWKDYKNTKASSIKAPNRNEPQEGQGRRYDEEKTGKRTKNLQFREKNSTDGRNRTPKDQCPCGYQSIRRLTKITPAGGSTRGGARADRKILP